MNIALIGRWLILAALGFASAGTVTGFVAGRGGSVTALRWTKWLHILVQHGKWHVEFYIDLRKKGRFKSIEQNLFSQIEIFSTII